MSIFPGQSPTTGPVNAPAVIPAPSLRESPCVRQHRPRFLAVLGLCGCQTAARPTSRGRWERKPKKPAPPNPGASSTFIAIAFAPIPRTSTRRCNTARRCAPAGQKAQAVAVLEQATIAHPSNKALLAGYGRALADNGNFQQAFDVLSRAHTPDDPDWRILSAQGAVLDQLGRYEEARQYYASALKIVARRTFRAVQSWTFLRAFERSAQGGGDSAPRLWPRGCRSAGAAESWRWWSACRAALPRPRAS